MSGRPCRQPVNDPMSEPIHIISLGAGVQSSTMALMAAAGEITPMPKCAIFADTGNEPAAVYAWLNHLQDLLPFPTYISKRNVSGSLLDHIFEWGHSQIPAYFKSADGSIGIGKRQCTKHWKLDVIKSKARQIIGCTGKRLSSVRVVMWQGISTDEVSRAKDSHEAWIRNFFPLLDKRMSRLDCVRWLAKHGYVDVPKSACFFCTFRGDAQWRATKQEAGADWGKCLELDRLLNERGEYLHRSCKPLSEVDFSTEEERGQLNMFNNECSGMCGV